MVKIRSFSDSPIRCGGGFVVYPAAENNYIVHVPEYVAEQLIRCGLAELVGDLQQICISVSLDLAENFPNSEKGKLL